MVRAARALIIWGLWLAFALPVWAAEVRLQLDVKELAVGQSGRLMVHVVDARPRGVLILSAPDGLALRVHGTSTRFQRDNFSRAMIHSTEYRLTALQPGDYTLGPFEVPLADGSTLQTNEVRLTVQAAAPGGDPMRVTAGFDRQEAYVGEVLLYRYKLVSTEPMMGVDWRLPDFEGLRQPQQGKPQERSYYVENPDGGRTTTAEGSIPLIATGTGDRTQPAALAQVRVPLGRSDLLGFRQYRTEVVPGDSAPLQILPLPRPEPDGFSGLVGDFQFRATLGSARAAVGESVTWRLEVAGDGVLEGWKPPTYSEVPAAIYENDQERNAWVDGDRYVAQGVWTRVVVPTEQGTLQLPPLAVVTFSPSRGEYVTHEVTVPPLEVRAGREHVAEMESFATEPEVGADPVGQIIDFRPIYRRGPARTLPLAGALTGLSGLAALPGLWVAGAVLGRRVRKYREARRVARTRPLTARQRVRRLPAAPEERLAALEGALRLALAQADGVAVEDLDRREAIGRLPEALAQRVGAASESLDRARFAGDAATEALEAEIIALIDLLEGR